MTDFRYRSGGRNRKMSESSTDSHLHKSESYSCTDSDLERIELERMPLKIVDRTKYEELNIHLPATGSLNAATTPASAAGMATGTAQQQQTTPTTNHAATHGRNVRRPRAIIPKPNSTRQLQREAAQQPLSASEYLENYFAESSSTRSGELTTSTSVNHESPKLTHSTQKVRYVLAQNTHHQSSPGEKKLVREVPCENGTDGAEFPKYALMDNQLIPIRGEQFVQYAYTLVKPSSTHSATFVHAPTQAILPPVSNSNDSYSGQLSDCSSSRSCSSISSSSGFGSAFGSDSGESPNGNAVGSRTETNAEQARKKQLVVVQPMGCKFKLRLPAEKTKCVPIFKFSLIKYVS